MNIFEHLRQAEGFRAHPYDDVGNLSIGYGRNLSSLGITREEAEIMLVNDVERVRTELRGYDWYSQLSPVRKMTVESLVYNLGISRFKTFKNCIAAISVGNFDRASQEIYPDSLYAKQLPDRAKKYAAWMKSDAVETT